MSIFLIRHGATAGNEKGCYIGSTDEELSENGKDALVAYKKDGIYPKVHTVYSSPMKRAIQTANIIYPDMNYRISDELREMDFGIYEGKNYKDLSDDMPYRKWLKSGGKLPFPGGEDERAFFDRSVAAYERIYNEAGQKNTDVAVITHGGVILSIRSYMAGYDRINYDYAIGNGECFEITC